MSVLTDKADLSLKMTGKYNELKEKLFEGSSEIVNGQRKEAFQDFILQGLPTLKNEDYKYTNVNPAFLPDYSFVPSYEDETVNLHEVFKCNVPQLDTHLVLMLNGWYYRGNAQVGDFPEGVILGSFDEISKKHPELVKDYYATLGHSKNDPIMALNTAFAKDGFFLYIPKNVEIEKPIQVINLMQASQDTYVTQRNLVVAEQGSKVKLIVCDHTLNVNRYLSNSVTEVFIKENASLDYYVTQNQHNKATCFNSTIFKQERDSRLNTSTISLHGGMIRNNLKVVFEGENCQADVFGMSFLDKKQHVDNFTQIIHAKPNCMSNQVYKNVLDDSATGAFAGRIHVMKDAQKTNAFQRNNNLLLTDTANMHTKPQLIIDADDVKCSHGATVGQIDKEALFYLRARGINEKEANLMMMNAFAHEVVQNIAIEPLRERIDELIEKRLKGEISECHNCAYKCEC